MNVPRVLRLVFLLLLLFASSAVAAPGGGILVLMDHTTGPAAWTAAERRLIAELRGLQMRVIVQSTVTELDLQLPERVQRAGAFVGIQVLRDGDRGIIRFYFAPQRGQRSGYQHVEINLRNADVVSRAVLPVVEAIFDRTQNSLQPPDDTRVASDVDADACATAANSQCSSRLALRLGTGAFLVNADTGVAPMIDLGARLRLWPGARLEVDASHLFPGIADPDETLHRQMLARAFILFESWGKDGRGAALGPGLGVVSVENSKEWAVVPTLGARVAFFTPLSRHVNLVFAVTGARMVGEPQGLEARPWFADATIGVDWYLWK